MKKISSFFEIIYLSFFSAEFYRDVYNNLQGKKLNYLLRLVAFVALVMAIIESANIWINFNQFDSTKTIDNILNQVPTMVIKNKELQILNKNVEGPIFVRNSEGKILVIIDDQAKDNKYQSENAPLVVIKTGMFLSDRDQIRFSSMMDKDELIVTHEVIIQYWQKTLEIFKLILPFILFVITFLELSIGTIFYALIFAGIVLLTHKIMQYKNISFEPLFRLAIFASFPSIIAMIPLFFMPALSPSWIYLAYLFFAYYNALYANKKGLEG
jgi:hypothetical protein